MTSSSHTPTDEELRAPLFNVIDQYRPLGLLSGCIFVERQGKPLLNLVHGFADEEHRAPVTTETVYQIGSITKSFTAALVFEYILEGTLTLDTAMDAYFPEVKSIPGVTLGHLLSHRSGITSDTSVPESVAWRSVRTPLETTIERIAKLDSLFEPGTKAAYSNSNYKLLGALLERLSNKSYATLVHERIFAPLAMSQSSSGAQDRIVPHMARGYVSRAGTLQPAAYIDLSIPDAAGAITSTSQDMRAWAHSLLPQGPFAHLREAMTQTFYPDTRTGENVAYGLFSDDRDDSAVIYHDGSMPGFVNIMAIEPDSRTVVVVLNNRRGETRVYT